MEKISNGSERSEPMSFRFVADDRSRTGRWQRTQAREGQEGTGCFRPLYPERRNSQNGRIFLPQGAILSERSEFPRATSQTGMLACTFGDCRESPHPYGVLAAPCGAQEYPDILRNFPLRISRPETASPLLPLPRLCPLPPSRSVPVVRHEMK